MQTVIFDQIYSFDIKSLLNSVPRPAGMTAAEFRPAAEELFNSMITAARGDGGGDADRALFFLVARYPGIYNLTAQLRVAGFRLKAVEVSLSPVCYEDRRIVNVFLTYANHKTRKTDRYVVGVDITDKFPFLVSKVSRCGDETLEV